MNEKGYVTLTVLIIVLIITSALLIFFYSPILNSTKNVAESRLLSTEFVRDVSGKERLYSTLIENISYEGVVIYEDIDREYEIKTLYQDLKSQELHFKQHGLSNDFFVNNATDIAIQLIVNPINYSKPYSYNVDLKFKGVDMLSGQGQNLQSDVNITVNSDKIYNKLTNETNYGNYTLNIPYANNCTVSAKILYEKLFYRKAVIEESNFKKTVIIKSDNSAQNTTLKFE